MRDQSTTEDFPVLVTVRKAYAAPVKNAGPLAQLLWPWLVAMAPVLLISGGLTWPWMERAIAGDSAARLALGWTGTVVSIPFLSGIAVAWHRFVLRGELAYTSRRIWWYMLSGAILWATVNVAASVGLWLSQSSAPEGGIVALVLTCALSVLAFRMSLVLPAVAVCSAVSWVQVWKLTSGNTWPIFFGAILAAAPLPIAQFALGLMIAPEMTRLSYMLSNVVLGLAEAILLVVSVGYLSFAYQRFFEPTERTS